MELKEHKFVSWAEARKILEEKEKNKELVYEQKNALEHLKKFSKLTPKKAEELYEELSKIKKLGEKNIISIIDHLPADIDDLKVLLSGKVDLTQDEKKKIIDIVEKI